LLVDTKNAPAISLGALILYGLSPMLAHGFALGRPDHQSLLLTLIAVALCANGRSRQQATRGWGIVSSDELGVGALGYRFTKRSYLLHDRRRVLRAV